jgi:hypothetical protein
MNTSTSTTTTIPTPKKGFTLVLKSRGNPDHGQDPERPLWGVPTKRVKVNSLKEAAQLVEAYIAEFNLGGGNWVGGQVFSGDNKTEQVAKITYNGRAWLPGPFPQPEILF